MRRKLLSELATYKHPARGASVEVVCPCGYKRIEGTADELLQFVGALCLGCGRVLCWRPPRLEFLD